MTNIDNAERKIHSLHSVIKNKGEYHNSFRFDITPQRNVLKNIHEEFVKNTHPGAIVVNKSVFLCHANFKALHSLGLRETEIYISSTVLKHMYDKRPAQEYDRLLNDIPLIIKYPDLVYKNKASHHGFAFVKALHGYSYMCPVKFIENGQNKLYVATAFSVKPWYMKDFKLVWSFR